MTIKDVEEQTGLARSNIRFYEKERLIHPSRNEGNGYRDYSDADVEELKKIAYLRTLGISVEEIRNIIAGNRPLLESVKKQNDALQEQIADLHKAKLLCEEMLRAENITYEALRVEQYVTGLQDYWTENRSVFRLDSVGFLNLWGSLSVWIAVTVACLFVAILFWAKLPLRIPVQWSGGEAVSFVNKNFIFAYPVVCIAIRFLIRPAIYARLQINNCYGVRITEYLTNCLCFVALTVEIFSILYVYGMVKNIIPFLAADAIILLSLLFAGIAFQR